VSGPVHIGVPLRDVVEALDRLRRLKPELDDLCRVAATVARELAKGSAARLPETAMDRGLSPVGWYWPADDPSATDDDHYFCAECLPGPVGSAEYRAQGLRPVLPGVDIPTTGLTVACSRCGRSEELT